MSARTDVDEPAQLAIEARAEQLLLGAVVQVQHRLRDLGLRGDRVHRRLVIAVHREHLHGGVEHLLLTHRARQSLRSTCHQFRVCNRRPVQPPQRGLLPLSAGDPQHRGVDLLGVQLAGGDGRLQRVEHRGNLVGRDPQRDVGTRLQRLERRLGDAVALVDGAHAGQVVGEHHPVERQAAVPAGAQQVVGGGAQAGRVVAGEPGHLHVADHHRGAGQLGQCRGTAPGRRSSARDSGGVTTPPWWESPDACPWPGKCLSTGVTPASRSPRA